MKPTFFFIQKQLSPQALQYCLSLQREMYFLALFSTWVSHSDPPQELDLVRMCAFLYEQIAQCLHRMADMSDSEEHNAEVDALFTEIDMRQDMIDYIRGMDQELFALLYHEARQADTTIGNLWDVLYIYVTNKESCSGSGSRGGG